MVILATAHGNHERGLSFFSSSFLYLLIMMAWVLGRAPLKWIFISHLKLNNKIVVFTLKENFWNTFDLLSRKHHCLMKTARLENVNLSWASSFLSFYFDTIHIQAGNTLNFPNMVFQSTLVASLDPCGKISDSYKDVIKERICEWGTYWLIRQVAMFQVIK